jgi:hypothetical protein
MPKGGLPQQEGFGGWSLLRLMEKAMVIYV